MSGELEAEVEPPGGGDELASVRVRFGEFELDPGRGELLRDGKPVRMQPKVYAALRMFIAHRGQLLSRQALLDALWNDVVVNHEAVTQTLRKLRRALGDDSKSPRFMETVPKRGYRFIAEIERVEAGEIEAPREVEAEADAKPEPASDPETEAESRTPSEPAEPEPAEPEPVAEVERNAEGEPKAELESEPRAEVAPAPNRPPPAEPAPTPRRPPKPVAPTTAESREQPPRGAVRTVVLFSRAIGVILMVLGVLASKVELPKVDAESSKLAKIVAEPLPAPSFVEPPPAPVRLTFTAGREHDFDLSRDGALAIVSMTEVDGSTHLFRFEVGGGDPVRLTATEGEDYNPRFVGSGERVLFARHEANRTSLWIASTLGGGETLLFPDAILGAPAPGGERVAVVRASASGATIELRSLPPSNEPEEASVLANTRSIPTDLRWSTDGEQLAWVEHETLWVSGTDEGPAQSLGPRIPGAHALAWNPSEDAIIVDGHRGLVRATLSDGTTRPERPTTNTARSPRFAADGRRLLYIEQRSATEVWVRSKERARDRVLDIKSSVQCVAPGPEGTWLAFFDTHPRGRETALGIIDLATGTRRHLVSRAGGCPSVTADGNALLASDREGRGLWKLPLDGGAPVSIVPELEVVHVAPSPVDARLALVTEDGLALASLESEEHRVVAKGRFGPPAWSPDGRHLALYGLLGDEAGLLVFELETEQLSLVTTEHHRTIAPMWHDDRTLLTVTNEDDTTRLKRVGLDGRTLGEEATFRGAPAAGRANLVDVRRGAPNQWFYTRRRIDSDLMEAPLRPLKPAR